MAAQEELPATIAQPRSDQVPLTRRDMERSAQQDLPAVLRLVDLGNVAVSVRTMQATAAAVRRIAAVLREGDFFDPAPGKQDPWEQTIGAIKAFAWPLLREFLTARDEQPLPETVEGFLAATARRAQALVPQGPALLIECADAALAELLATEEPTAKLCQRTGERGIVVRAEAEDKFRKAIRQLGYGMPHA